MTSTVNKQQYPVNPAKEVMRFTGVHGDRGKQETVAPTCALFPVIITIIIIISYMLKTEPCIYGRLTVAGRTVEKPRIIPLTVTEIH